MRGVPVGRGEGWGTRGGGWGAWNHGWDTDGHGLWNRRWTQMGRMRIENRELGGERILADRSGSLDPDG